MATRLTQEETDALLGQARSQQEYDNISRAIEQRNMMSASALSPGGLTGAYPGAAQRAAPASVQVPSRERSAVQRSDTANNDLMTLAVQLRSVLAAGDKAKVGWAIEGAAASKDLRRFRSPAMDEAMNACRDVITGCAINCLMVAIGGCANIIITAGIYRPSDWVAALIQAHDDGALSMEALPKTTPDRAMVPINPPDEVIVIPAQEAPEPEADAQYSWTQVSKSIDISKDKDGSMRAAIDRVIRKLSGA